MLLLLRRENDHASSTGEGEVSIRWRANGDLVCAAMTEPEPNDTYIDDRLHYQLSVISRAIIADPKHEENALWYWVHSDDGLRLRGTPVNY